jgi:hypothetical protein
MVRQRADWMGQVDEQILELLREEGNLNPATVEKFDVTVGNYASNRLSLMTDYGLVERLGPGLYRITEAGEAFLDGDLDASTLDGPDED